MVKCREFEIVRPKAKLLMTPFDAEIKNMCDAVVAV